MRACAADVVAHGPGEKDDVVVEVHTLPNTLGCNATRCGASFE
jgi:hypothetical protein